MNIQIVGRDTDVHTILLAKIGTGKGLDAVGAAVDVKLGKAYPDESLLRITKFGTFDEYSGTAEELRAVTEIILKRNKIAGK